MSEFSCKIFLLVSQSFFADLMLSLRANNIQFVGGEVNATKTTRLYMKMDFQSCKCLKVLIYRRKHNTNRC